MAILSADKQMPRDYPKPYLGDGLQESGCRVSRLIYDIRMEFIINQVKPNMVKSVARFMA